MWDLYYLFAIGTVYCFAMLWLMRRSPIWLRLLICTLELVLLCPVLIIHEGGGGFAPLIYWFYYLVDLNRDDLKSVALQISFVWAVANGLLLIVVGIRYFIRRAKNRHVA
jgi:hypothetical protein